MQHVLQNRVADLIRKLLSDSNFTQLDLAKKTGFTRQTISNYLNGRTDLNLNALEIIICSIGFTNDSFFALLLSNNKQIAQVNEPAAVYNNGNRLRELEMQVEYLIKIDETKTEHIQFLKKIIEEKLKSYEKNVS